MFPRYFGLQHKPSTARAIKEMVCLWCGRTADGFLGMFTLSQTLFYKL